MNHHGVANAGRSQNVLHREALLLDFNERSGRPDCHVGPDRLTGWREGRMWQRHAKGFADHLRGGGSPEELTATTGGSARPATEFGGLLQGNQSVGITCSNSL